MERWVWRVVLVNLSVSVFSDRGIKEKETEVKSEDIDRMSWIMSMIFLD